MERDCDTREGETPEVPGPVDPPVIRTLGAGDRTRAVEIINTAAEWYREFTPPEELHTPEMDEAAWETEAGRMTWWGAFAGDRLVGVMGSEPLPDATLLRHAYILPDHQRRGIGSALLRHVEGRLPSGRRVIVGTYAANYKARSMLEKAGYALSPDPETVLRAYYDIPEGRLATSVTYEKKLG